MDYIFDYIKKRKNKQTRKQELAQSKGQRDIVFQNSGVVDVTYFDAMTPDDPLGYMCGSIIQVFSDGCLIVYSADENSILESINLTDLINASNNINNYDPVSQNMVSLMTEEEDVRIVFQSIEIKKRFGMPLMLFMTVL